MKKKWLLGWGAALVLVLGFVAAVAVLSPGRASSLGADRVGVVEVKGFIADSRGVVDALRAFQRDDKVKAVVLRVDSPGGLVAPSQEMHDEVERTAARKPVVVSMGTVAASGGYYLAAPATKIVANPGTATGSIGVIIHFQEFHELLGKLGLRNGVVKSGEMKDAGSPFRPMKPGERALFQGLVDDLFGQFVEAVCKGRRLSRVQVLALADGRVYSGRQALGLRLVDQLGGFWDAVALAQKLAKLSGEPNLEYRGKKPGGVLRLLLGDDSEALAALRSAGASPLRFSLPGW